MSAACVFLRILVLEGNNLPNDLGCLVSEGFWVNGVFGRQRDAAEEDEEKDDVGEGGGVDNPVAQFAEPVLKRDQRLCQLLPLTLVRA